MVGDRHVGRIDEPTSDGERRQLRAVLPGRQQSTVRSVEDCSVVHERQDAEVERGDSSFASTIGIAVATLLWTPIDLVLVNGMYVTVVLLCVTKQKWLLKRIWRWAYKNKE